MDKKYNGFNNGRDKSDGVGGREVNHGTQTMTKEQSAVEFIHSNIGSITGKQWDVLHEGKKIEQQQLSAERESHINMVKQIVELLGFAKCLNILDALEKWQKERERAGKLVEALKFAFDEFEDLNLHRQAARIHETLNELKSRL